MHKNTVIKLFVILTFVCPLSALADNNIPSSYEAAYHNLLGKKQRLMDDRADSIRNLNQVDSWLKQVDRALTANYSMVDRQKLLSSRSYLLDLKIKHQKNFDYQVIQLQNVDKDLAWIEGEMKHFACMK